MTESRWSALKKYLLLFPPFRDPKPLAFIPLYIGALFFSFYVMEYTGFLKVKPNGVNLMNWDAGWYDSIRNNGYEYFEDRQSNSGFYPLFSIIWRVIKTSATGIGLINLGLAMVSMGIMAYTFRMKTPELMTFATFPSMLFLYVPYPESLYFFGCTLFAAGVLKEKNWLVCTGLLLASMTRPSAMFFIPAIIGMEILSIPRGKIPWVRIIKNTLLYLSFALLGLLLVLILQYVETGVWPAYFKAHKHWEHHLKIPGLPFVTWDGHRLIWLDGLALFAGVISAALVIRQIVLMLRKKAEEITPHRKIYLFSLVYVALIVLSLLSFNTQDDLYRTSLFALNRYVFVTPFVLIIIHYLMLHAKINAWKITGVITLALCTWLMTDIYHIPKYFMPLLFVTVYMIGLMFFMFYKPAKSLWVAFVCLHLFLQHWLLQFFIKGYWVG